MDLSVAGIIFDLDGTVYLGDEAIPGAVDAIGELRAAGIRTLFVSNKPLEPRIAYAANAAKTCPLPGGGIPDAGATIAALEHISGRKLELLAGKPSPLITEAALQKLDLPPQRCLMVGDRLETDILMGQNAGMRTAAVLTGASTRADIGQMTSPPDFVLESVAEIPGTLGRE